ncbi:MAG: hypothetical protein HEEMFOPI_01726 [Holosporales bacterium]
MKTVKIPKKTKKKILKHNNPAGHRLVYQHNNLVEARYDLTLQEKRIIVFALSKIKPEDIAFNYVTFDVKELCELCGVEGENYYSDLRRTTKRLRERTMEVMDLDNQILTQVGWIDRIVYNLKKGTISIRFHEFLSGFLLQLKSSFTAIPLSQTLGLSSAYAVRMFEILKQYEKIGSRELTLDEIRAMLGIQKEKFAKYNDFKRFVLDISVREINKKTDIFIDYEEIKDSRKVSSIYFTIQKNKNFGAPKNEQKTKLLEIKNESKEGIKISLAEIGFSRPTIKKFLDNYEEVKISKALAVLKNQVSKGQVLNTKAFFRKALQEDWSLDKYKPKKKDG